jgi:hypothetical protein
MMPVLGKTTVLSMLSVSTRLDRTSVFVNLATLEMAGNVKVGMWDSDTKKKFDMMKRYTRKNLTTCRQDVFATGL